MLVIQRRANEGVLITLGKIRVRVIVAKYADGKVKLGIDAPPEVTVHRDEVQAEIGKEHRNG